MFVHRTRALLAATGVAVGVAAVIVSRAVGAGAEAQMRRTVESIGTNLLIVKPLPVKREVARPEISGPATTLVVADADAIGRLDTVHAVAPAVERPTRVKIGNLAMRTTVRGTTIAFPAVRNFEIGTGRYFDAADDRLARRVVVLGSRVREELGGGGSLVGTEMRVDGVPFEVIGVFKARGATIDGADQDNFVAVPLRTALRRVFNTTWLTNVYVGVADPDGMAETAASIERLLRGRHQHGMSGQPDDFAVQNTTRTRVFQQEMIDTLSRYAAGLAAIALVVGGTGILALMLLSVKERTSEIGLRMAVGARPLDILIQFLLEAATLAVGGWSAGLVLAAAGSAALAYGTSWPVGVPTMAIAGTFGMVLIIGLGFGALPARNAARIPPIDALVMR